MKRYYHKNQVQNSSLICFDPFNLRLGPFDFKNFPTVDFRPGVTELPDGEIVLQYYAPDAAKVEYFGGTNDAPKYAEFEKADGGYWKCVLSEVPAGLHTFDCKVDGVTALNQLAPICYTSGRLRNYFEKTDETSAFYFVNRVPHGDLRMEYYRSSVTGAHKTCWVYTPPGYDQNPDKRYPTLYLQHGGGENESCWIDLGKINFIMDNLLASGRAKEMLIVMANGYAWTPDDTREFPPGDFDKELTECVLPHIEGKYRTIQDRESRAIAGISMGAFQAKQIGFSHLDLFASVGVIIGHFNGGMHKDPIVEKALEDIPALAAKLKLLFCMNGEQEGSYPSARETMEKLAAQGLPNVYYSCPGYHSITTARQGIRELLPLLFQ